MRRKLRTKRGRQRYALRMATVEPVFGQIKQGRGFRHFLLRGLRKVQGEWSLICTGHNLLKLFRFGGPPHGKGLQPHIRTAGFFRGNIQLEGRRDQPFISVGIGSRQQSSDGLLVSWASRPPEGAGKTPGSPGCSGQLPKLPCKEQSGLGPGHPR